MEACGRDDGQPLVKAVKVALHKVCKCRPLVRKDIRHLFVGATRSWGATAVTDAAEELIQRAGSIWN